MFYRPKYNYELIFDNLYSRSDGQIWSPGLQFILNSRLFFSRKSHFFDILSAQFLLILSPLFCLSFESRNYVFVRKQEREKLKLF